MKDYTNLLDDLRERLIQLTHNELVDKKLVPGGKRGAGNVINLINEVPSVIVDQLLNGCELCLDPLKAHVDFLADEDDELFIAALALRLDLEGQAEADYPEEDLRAIKDEIRAELGMLPIEGVIPKEFYDLDTVVDPNKKEHSDSRIQTDIPEAELAAHCKKIKKAILEEQREKGMDTCYLAVGFLKWTQEKKDKKKQYNSPVFLIPCVITEREKRFYLEYSGKDYGTNPILSYIFRQELKREFPPYQAVEGESSGIHEYLAEVDAVLQGIGREDWSFEHRMAAGQFKSRGIPISELEPEGYSESQVKNCYEVIGKSRTITELPLHEIDNEAVTRQVPCAAIAADSSQYSTVYDVAQGNNLVIEGPPGTGKSQTIVNLLANAIQHGRKVLFLAQKPVALNVVYTRMQEAGLGGKCMPLHSDYTRKSTLFEKIGHVVQSSGSSVAAELAIDQFKQAYDKYNQCRVSLNDYCQFLKYPVGETGLTAQEVITGYTTLEDIARPEGLLTRADELTKHAIGQMHEGSKRVQELIDLIGVDFFTASTIINRTNGFDAFELKDLKPLLSAGIKHLEVYLVEQPFTAITKHSDRLSHLREQLGLSLKLQEANTDIDANYVRAAIPERAELEKIKQVLISASFLGRYCSPRVFLAKKQVSRLLVCELKSYDSLLNAFLHLLERLEQIDGLEQALERLGTVLPSIEQLQQEIPPIETSLQEVAAAMEFIPNLFSNRYDDLELSELLQQLKQIAAYPDKINQRIDINLIQSEQLAKYLPKDFVSNCVAIDASVPVALELTLYETLARGLSKHFPKYDKYRGDYIEHLRVRLAETATQLEARYREMLAAQTPTPAPAGNSATRVKEKTGQTLINHIRKTPGARLTVREFMARAGKELNAYAPCFLMTPSSVAEFLNKDFKFDLLVVDEASQMLTEEAAGALLRSKQVVVVGDSQQMPPTVQRVSKLQQPEGGQDTKNESILQRASECFEYRRMLLYHYRSKHDSLIQFSNAEFYDEALRIIPSTREKSDTLGLQYIEVNGIYTGKQKNGVKSAHPNPLEAQRVVDEVCGFMRDPANRERSLGVAALNKRQAIHIEKLLDKAIEADAILRDYVEAWQDSPEYFFVKNLETVQGDERDVMLLSTVFGPTAEGKVAQNFGPINQPQGEKRINVLITRAKERLSIFTSLKPSDITNQSIGAQVWKRYLDFAKTGQLQGLDSADVNCQVAGSLNQWFHDRLTQDGFGVTSQVGVSEWRVDLGIRHDANPGHYICGIQFDGSQYYNTSYALERDHLRDRVLEHSGWTIIRVWSVDFFADREATYNKVKTQIEAALAAKCAAVESGQD